jgi:hypothetical protein
VLHRKPLSEMDRARWNCPAPPIVAGRIRYRPTLCPRSAVDVPDLENAVMPVGLYRRGPASRLELSDVGARTATDYTRKTVGEQARTSLCLQFCWRDSLGTVIFP